MAELNLTIFSSCKNKEDLTEFLRMFEEAQMISADSRSHRYRIHLNDMESVKDQVGQIFLFNSDSSDEFQEAVSKCRQMRPQNDKVVATVNSGLHPLRIVVGFNRIQRQIQPEDPRRSSSSNYGQIYLSISSVEGIVNSLLGTIDKQVMKKETTLKSKKPAGISALLAKLENSEMRKRNSNASSSVATPKSLNVGQKSNNALSKESFDKKETAEQNTIVIEKEKQQPLDKPKVIGLKEKLIQLQKSKIEKSSSSKLSASIPSTPQNLSGQPSEFEGNSSQASFRSEIQLGQRQKVQSQDLFYGRKHQSTSFQSLAISLPQTPKQNPSKFNNNYHSQNFKNDTQNKQIFTKDKSYSIEVIGPKMDDHENLLLNNQDADNFHLENSEQFRIESSSEQQNKIQQVDPQEEFINLPSQKGTDMSEVEIQIQSPIFNYQGEIKVINQSEQDIIQNGEDQYLAEYDTNDVKSSVIVEEIKQSQEEIIFETRANLKQNEFSNIQENSIESDLQIGIIKNKEVNHDSNINGEIIIQQEVNQSNKTNLEFELINQKNNELIEDRSIFHEEEEEEQKSQVGQQIDGVFSQGLDNQQENAIQEIHQLMNSNEINSQESPSFVPVVNDSNNCIIIEGDNSDQMLSVQENQEQKSFQISLENDLTIGNYQQERSRIEEELSQITPIEVLLSEVLGKSDNQIQSQVEKDNQSNKKQDIKLCYDVDRYTFGYDGLENDFSQLPGILLETKQEISLKSQQVSNRLLEIETETLVSSDSNLPNFPQLITQIQSQQPEIGSNHDETNGLISAQEIQNNNIHLFSSQNQDYQRIQVNEDIILNQEEQNHETQQSTPTQRSIRRKLRTSTQTPRHSDEKRSNSVNSYLKHEQEQENDNFSSEERADLDQDEELIKKLKQFSDQKLTGEMPITDSERNQINSQNYSSPQSNKFNLKLNLQSLLNSSGGGESTIEYYDLQSKEGFEDDDDFAEEEGDSVEPMLDSIQNKLISDADEAQERSLSEELRQLNLAMFQRKLIQEERTSQQSRLTSPIVMRLDLTSSQTISTQSSVYDRSKQVPGTKKSSDLSASQSAFKRPQTRFYKTDFGPKKKQLEPKSIMLLNLSISGQDVDAEIYAVDNAYTVIDRISLKLNRKFNPQQTRTLALIIQTRINDYINSLEQYISQQEKSKFLGKDSIQSFIEERNFSERHTITSGYEKSNQIKQKKDTIIGKLSVDLGSAAKKVRVISIRENDDPYELAFSFVKTYNVKKSMVAILIEQISQIQTKFRQRSHLVDPSESLQISNIQHTSNLDQRIELYNVSVETSQEQGDFLRLAVREGEEIEKVAFDAINDNNLSEEFYPVILQALQAAQEVIKVRSQLTQQLLNSLKLIQFEKWERAI